LGPGGRDRFNCLVGRLGNFVLERCLSLERDWFDGELGLRLRPGLGLRDQTLSEAPGTRLRAITAALDGLIRAFPFARAIAVSVAIALGVSREVSLRVSRPFGIAIFDA
jgi:hypothetical protein